MPLIARIPEGTVTGLWGSAHVKIAGGKMRPLRLGDRVHAQDQILTADNGIVRIMDAKGKTWLPRAQADKAHSELDQVLGDLNQASPRDAAAAGLTAAAGDGTLGEGLRLERIVEVVTPLEFSYSTPDRGALDPMGHTVEPGAQALPAIDDAVRTEEDRPVDIAVVANDGTADTQGLHVTAVNGVALAVGQSVALASGTVTLLPDGQLRFTPAPDSHGPVQFTYTVTDASGRSADASVQVDVSPVNDPPVARNDQALVTEDTPATGNVLGNDLDTDGDTLQVTQFTVDGHTHAAGDTAILPGIGRLSIGSDGHFVFTPAPDYVGPIPVATYTVTDGSATATAELDLGDVVPVNDPPVAVVTPASGNEDTPIAVNLSGADVDGHVSSVAVTTLPPATQGVLYLPDGTTPVTAGTALSPADAAALVFKPAADFNGAVQIGFTVTDDQGAVSAPAIAPITVLPVVDPVISIDDVVVNEAAGTVTFTVTLDQATSAGVSVEYGTTPGSAGAADFSARSGTLHFAPGVLSQTLTVPLSNDGVYEGSETFQVLLKNPVNATIGDGEGLATIRDDGTGVGGSDDDRPAVASVSSPTVVEGGNLDFTVALNHTSTTPTTISLTPASGSATLGTDTSSALQVSFDGGASWAPVSGSTVTVPAGASSFVVRVPSLDDSTGEATESFTLGAATPQNAAPVVGTATITDNDTPAFSINDVTVNEGAGTATFTVTLSNPSAATTSVAWATSNGSALAGSDYAASSGTLSFAPGVVTQTVTVAITNDAVFEGPEAFNVNLSSPTGGATIADALGVGSIRDDGTGLGGTNDDTPTLSVSSVTVAESAGYAVFSVSLSNPSATPTTVNLGTSAGSATSGLDFGPALQVSTDGGVTWTAGSAATIAAGSTAVLVRAAVLEDTIDEPNESFSLTATVSAGTTTNASATGVATITDNDNAPVIGLSGPGLVNEAAGTVTYTVTLSNPSASTVSVNYGTVNGSATAGSDFTAASGSLSFAPGETSKTITVAITNDAVYEGSESYAVSLSAPTNATLGTASVSTTIADDGTGLGGTNDDRPAVASVSSPTVVEGGNLDFTVALNHTSTTPTTVSLTPASGSATLGTDTSSALQVSFDGGATWAAVSGSTVTVPAGASSFVVRVPTVNDNISEPSESLTLSASTAQNSVPVTGTGTVTDNDGTPSLSISGPGLVNEAAGTVTYTVTLSNPSASTVSVNYGTVNGSAIAGSDFTATSGSLSFAPGETSKTITVAITNDTVYEGSESYSVSLSSPTSATLGTASVSTAIADDGTGLGGSDDDRPAVASVSSPTVVEGGNLDFTVALTNASTTPTTVSLTPASGSATLGTDTSPTLQVSFDGGATWAPVSGSTVTVPAGSSSFVVRVPSINDSTSEANETITLGAASPHNTAPVVGTGTLIDNDGAPQFSIDDVTVNEAAGTATFTVTLSNPSAVATSVNYASSNGSAVAGADFVASSGTLNFAAGVLSHTVTVAITNDTVFEGPEAFNLILSNPTGGATIADALGVGTILDDGTGPGGTNDDRPIVNAITPATVAEGGNLDFTVSLSNASTHPTTVNLSPTSGTATLGTDTNTSLQVSFDGGSTWSAIAGTTVSVPAGSTSFIVRMPTLDDSVGEPTESVTLGAATAQNITPVLATGTITDNDLPVAHLSGPVTYNEAAGTATFTVSLTNASTLPVTIQFATVDGSAVAGSDYTATSGILNFAPGVTTQTITVAITNDTVFEGAESFDLHLTSASNASLGTASSTATIVDDGSGVGGSNDDTPSLSINDVVVNEAAGTATFTVSLSSAAAIPVSVGYALGSGTATAGTDFTAGSGTLNFAPGVTTMSITVPISNDAVFEGPEAFNVNLSSPVNATISDALGVGTIRDDGTGAGGSDDDRPAVASVSSPTVVEGGNLDFTVALNHTSTTPTTVSLTPASGSAVLGTDTSSALQVSFDGGATWATVSGSTVTVPAGSSSFVVRIPTVNDNISEPSESLTLSASTAQNSAPVVGTGTVTDNDGTPSLSISGPGLVNEAAGTVTYTVTLSNPSASTVSVNYGTVNGSAMAGSDFTATSGSLSFAPGETSKTITVAITNDTVYEGSESYAVSLSAPTNATLGTASVSTAIADDGTGAGGSDDDRPAVASVSSPTVVEGGNLDFTVALNHASTTPTTVSLTPASGSATLGTDTSSALQVSFDGGATWATVSGSTVTVPAGSSSFVVRVPTVNDNISEPSESLTLSASTAQNSAPVVGTGTVTDNDGTPSLSISGPGLVNEAAGTVTYTVTLSNPSASTVSVNYGTVNGSAIAGSDFTAASGSLSFAPGETSKTITVAITNDTVYEGSESYSVSLSAPTNATLGTGSVSTAIADDGTGAGGSDDDRPAVASVSSPTVVEGGNLDFTVALNHTSTTPTTVSLTPASGSAVLGTDTSPTLQVSFDGGATWAAVSGSTVTVPAGSSSFVVRVPSLDDSTGEATESFTLGAATPQNAAPVVGTATITDNDTPAFSINDVTVNEGAGTATFTVTLSNPSAATTSVAWATSNGSALAGSDYSASSGTLSFAPGVVTQTVTVAITNDAVFEGPESFNVNLSSPTGGATIADALGVGSIRDDGTGAGGTNDDRPAVASVSSPTVVEGGNLDFTVALTNASTTPTTVSLTPASGSAVLGTDTSPTLQVSFDGGATWAPVSGSTVTVPAGSSSFVVRLPTVNDNISEPSESLTLSASTTQNSVPVTGTGTVTDNDGTPSLSISGPGLVNEAAGTVTYTVTLSNPSASTVSVNYGTVNGSAIAGSDFTAASGSLSFAPGETSKTITVAITNDTVYEGSESYSVSLSAPTNATLGTGSVSTAIADDGTGAGGSDDDRPAVASVSSPTVVEGGNLDFTVALNHTSTTPTTVSLTPASGSATLGTDTSSALQVSFDGGATWATVSGSIVTVPAGSSSFVVRLPTVNDNISEPSESLTLSASTTQNSVPVTGTGTVTDNDGTPTLSINDVTVNEAAGTATFTVTLSNPSASAVTVGWASGNGSALAEGDYTAGSGTLNFAPGVVTQTVTVAIANDTVFEGSETFNINLSSPTNATLADAVGVGTIKDDGTGSGGTDNDTPTLSVSSTTLAESAGYAVFTVSLSNASATATTVSLGTTAGTASTADFGSSLQVSTDGGATWTAGSSATIAAGSTSVLVRAPIVDDALAEPNESFTLTATRTGGTTSNAAASGTATITDNDTPAFSINDVTVNEGAGTATFTVTLSNPSATTTSVAWATSNGSALAGSDYAASSGTLSFAPGVVTQTVTVAITNDAVFEGPEAFNVNLSSPTGGATIADALGVGSIRDDGTGLGGTNDDTPTLSVSSVTVAESAGYAVFSVSLSNPSATPTTVNLGTSAGSATSGLDFGPALQVSTDGGVTWTAGSAATIAAGSTAVLVRAAVLEDTIDEPNESFSLTATVSAGTTTNASATGVATITDNDNAPVIGLSGPGLVNEAAGTVTYTVTLSNPSASTVSVNYGTVNGSATAGSDFTAASGSLSFAPGETSKTITVAITNDAVYEGSESYAVSLSAPTNATLGTASVSTAIADDGTGAGGSDDDRPAVASVSSPTVVEGGNLDFTVALNHASTTPTTVSLTPASGSATLGTDTSSALQVSFDGGATWATVSGSTVTVPAGSSSFVVRVPTVNDNISEPSESLTLSASTAQNSAPVVGTGTVTDNDGTPSLSISGPGLVNEAAGTVTYTVTLSNPSASTVSVNYGTVNGSAIAGSDFTAASGSLSFAPGETSKTITVAITNDTVYEGSESYSVSLSAPTNATLGTASVSTTIADDGTGAGGTNNDTPTLSVSSTTVAESAGYAVFTVSLSNASATATTVSLGTTAGTASTADFGSSLQVSTDGGATWTAGSSATIAAGSTSVLVRAPIVDDTLGENSEAFTLTATRTAGASTNASASGSATITDNDTPAFSINDVTVNEGAGTATFTVTLSNPSALSTSVNYASSSGTATSGVDFTASSGTLSFAPGVTSRTVTISLTDDALTESSETFNITLSAPVNATVADGLGVATVIDNDTPPQGRDIALTTLEDTPVVFGLSHFLMNDAEQGNNVNPSLVRVDTLPNNGSLYLNGVLVVAGQVIPAADIASGLLTFHPAPEANGSNYANFNFSVQDASGLYDPVPNTVTVNVTPVSDGAPAAGNDAFITTLGTPITITAAQLLTNDALPDHAHITGISGVSSGALVNNGDGTYTYTPAATGTASFTYMLTDDDGQTSTATVSIQTVTAKDDLATVYESALPTGTGGGSVVASGNLLANDGSGTSITNVAGITDGSALDTDARAGYIGVTTAQGRLVVDSTGTGAGDYTYTLVNPASNGTGATNTAMTEVFNYTSNTSTAALRVTVVDDQPAAYNNVVQISEDALPSYNLVLVLDVSGSMTAANAGGEVQRINADGSITITTRLAMAKEAMAALVSEYFNQAQAVSITLVTFSSAASVINPGAPYTSKDDAIAAINGLTGSGGTNYESALTAVQSAFGPVNPAVQNSVYFISDGEPSVGNVTDPANTSGYTSFVSTNGIDSFAVGIGTGIANTGPLNAIHNVDADGNGVSDGAIIVPDLNQLSASLLSTIPVAYGGNVVHGGDAGSAFGADGGHVQTVSLMLDSNGDGTLDQNVTFTYNAATHQITQNSSFLSGFPLSGDLLTLSTAQGFDLGKLTFNFSTGQYTYFTGGHAAQGDSFSFTFVAQDNDGDVTAPATLTVQIADGQPVARPDGDSIFQNDTHAQGNVISGMGTDGGLALGSQITTFAAGGSGADSAVDGAQVSSVNFQGQNFDLTTNSSGSGAGYTYTISGGQLTWTATTGGASLVFNRSGFYDYTAPTADRPVITTTGAQTVTFTAAPAAATGVTLEAYGRTGTAQTLTYSNPTGTTSDGVGVTGGGSAANVDNLESLAVNFTQATHPNGVANVSFVVATAASNLGSSGGVVSSLTYTVYDMGGHQIGQFYSAAEGTITVPSDLTNIGRIEIEANSAASARITSVSFADVQTNTTSAAIAPVSIGYTLTDTDGDSSSSTLTIRTIQNQLFGDSADNTVTGTNANDRIVGGAGNDTLNGGTGNDLLEGGIGNDTLNGGDGNDELRGGNGNDVLNGGNGNDVVVGGAGNDTLSGGAGADVFRWELADRGAAGSPAVDTVIDFNAAPVASGGDILDLRDLLQGETLQGSSSGNLLNFLHFSQAGGNTVLQVSANGGFSSGFHAGATDQTIMLQGLDLTSGGTLSDQQIINNLIQNGKLLVDH